ncbi:WD40-repeat-containing domain protein, partial [Piptocephalis cylindrospora]
LAMNDPLGPSIASDSSTLFQTDAALDEAERRSKLAKLELGSPVKVGSKVLCMQVTKGDIAWVGCANHTARRINLKTGTLNRVYQGHGGPVTAIGTGASGELYTGSWDKTLRKWDASTRECQRIYQGHTDFVRALVVAPPFLYSGSTDKTLRRWRISDGQCDRVFEGHTRGIEAMVLLDSGSESEAEAGEDKTLLYSASSDRTIRVWDVESGVCLRVLEGHLTTIYALVPGMDGSDLWSGSADKDVLQWDLTLPDGPGEPNKVLPPHPDVIKTLLVTGAGRYLVTGGRDECVRVWEVSTGKCVGLFEGHYDEVVALASSTLRASLIYSASLDGTIRQWELTDAGLSSSSRARGDALKKTLKAPKTSDTGSGGLMTEEEERELAELMGSD